MFLSDKDIERAIKAGEIRIEPFEKKLLQPASYDIRLGNHFVVDELDTVSAIDPTKNIFPQTRTIEITGNDTYTLQPGMSVLCYSHELFGSSNHLIKVNSKSSLARLGLVVHNATGIVNPGHVLNVALELTNANRVPIVLRPMMEIAQITFSPLSSEAKKTYTASTHQFLNAVGGYAPPKSGPLARGGKHTKNPKKR